jgi:hypothetical protein
MSERPRIRQIFPAISVSFRHLATASAATVASFRSSSDPLLGESPEKFFVFTENAFHSFEKLGVELSFVELFTADFGDFRNTRDGRNRSGLVVVHGNQLQRSKEESQPFS